MLFAIFSRFGPPPKNDVFAPSKTFSWIRQWATVRSLAAVSPAVGPGGEEGGGRSEEMVVAFWLAVVWNVGWSLPGEGLSPSVVAGEACDAGLLVDVVAEEIDWTEKKNWKKANENEIERKIPNGLPIKHSIWMLWIKWEIVQSTQTDKTWNNMKVRELWCQT